ncbi:MAG: tetratricopeptide repeat protein [Xenococcaceae cyanobacterium MO_207.B15]|nr:tetratricopeptide repeat protein [Xenococcaceae cyanobacterium MO_207.B15]
MIKLLSRSVIALTLILGFALAVKPITVSEANNLYVQTITTDEEKLATANRLFEEGKKLYQQGTQESLLQALEKLQKALPLYQAINKPLEESVTLFLIGTVYNDLGSRQKALDYYNQVLSISRKLSDLLAEAMILRHIGNVYDSIGEKQKALDYYYQALSLSGSIQYLSEEAINLYHIGTVYNISNHLMTLLQSKIIINRL